MRRVLHIPAASLTPQHAFSIPWLIIERMSLARAYSLASHNMLER